MAGPYLADGEWPIWDYVEGALARRDLDARELIRSLPRVGSQSAVGPSYGLAWFDRHGLADQDRPALTVAASYHLPELGTVLANPFLNVLRIMVELQVGAPSSPNQVSRPTITPALIKQTLPSISDSALKRLPEILLHEPPTRGGSYSHDPNDPLKWQRQLTRELLKYRNVQDIKTYIERVSSFMPSAVEPKDPVIIVNGLDLSTDTFLSIPEGVAASPPEGYVSSKLVVELEQKKSALWSVDKLIQLVKELNSNFRDDRWYSCHALLRAILDHTPPVFGCKTFDQVVSNHSWGRTDQKHLKRLQAFRNAADDVLHRQIRKSADVISLDDLPERAAVNAFLRECVDLL
ncbi:hypothetical protein JJ691_56700 [Kutzneria sp. CA-103260]|nr:hypothetical protein JJ691_56700 [Kutzneria sp. CA-103260]